MDNAAADVLADIAFPAQHPTKLHSTTPLERLNKEVKRRAGVVGKLPFAAGFERDRTDLAHDAIVVGEVIMIRRLWV